MKRKNVPVFVGAIEDAINVLEYHAHKYKYSNDAEHQRLVVYLQKAKEKNTRRTGGSKGGHI